MPFLLAARQRNGRLPITIQEDKIYWIFVCQIFKTIIGQ